MHFKQERQALGPERGRGLAQDLPLSTRSGEGRHTCWGHNELRELGRRQAGMLGRRAGLEPWQSVTRMVVTWDHVAQDWRLRLGKGSAP